MRNQFLASTLLARRPIAFQNTMAPVPPGQTNIGLVMHLMAAAQAAGDQQAPTTDEDLGARDIASTAMLPYWDLTDDIVEGYDVIKARGQKYLPKFADETNDDYNGRLGATEFTNVYRDIVESLAGKPFEEEITVVTDKKEDTGEDIPLPDKIDAFIEDVDGAGNNLTSFSALTFFNGINSAIDWIFVDYPKVDREKIKTEQDLIDNGIRPFWSHVLGRNVLEAKSQVIGGKETLIKMRILEPGAPNHIRVFERMPDGLITWGLFEEKLTTDAKKKTYILVDSGTVTIGEIPLVPFATGRRDGRTYKFFPVMRDAADLQIQLYQQESALKFAKIMTAYPMLAANGISPEMEADGKTPKKLAVGPGRVLYSKPDGSGNVGNWQYITPDAACLTFLKEDIKETMQQLRELGRQPLTAQSGNLTVITTAYAAGKARTAVGAWALRLKDSLENALRLTCLWLNITTDDYEPEISIYDEYDDFATDQGADMSALQYARDKREISGINYRRELMRRATLRPDFNEDENTAQLLDETPSDALTGVDEFGNPLPAPTPGVKPPVKKKLPPKKKAATK